MFNKVLYIMQYIILLYLKKICGLILEINKSFQSHLFRLNTQLVTILELMIFPQIDY